MPEFMVGKPLRKIARRHEFLRRALWRMDYVLVWSLVSVFRLLPVEWASGLGAAAAAVIGPMMKDKTTLLTENFRVVFPDRRPDEIRQIVRASWHQAGRVLGELPHLDRIVRSQAAERLEIVVEDPNAIFADRDRPTVVVAAHLSNWELVPAAMGHLGITSTALYSPITNPWLDRMLRQSRAALGCQLLPRDDSARQLVEKMKTGETVGMIIDRRVDEGKPIPFFGKTKNTSTMPAKLALRFDCDLIPARVERIKGARFRVSFYPPVRPHNPHDSKGEQAIDMTRQVHQLFETWIRKNPADWFCTARLWPKVKQGATH
jgi:KDO2-lipid IV(A) lauroyltransferase